MKKLILFSALSALSTIVSAQVKFGAQVGANLGSGKETVSYGGVSETDKYTSKFGIVIGGFAQMPISTSIDFRPELNYIQKGGKYSESYSILGTSYTTTDEITMNYIEVPLNIIYSVAAGNGTVFLGGGPAIGLGISGNNKVSSGGKSESTTIKFDGNKDAKDSYDHYKALNVGFGFMAGYELTNGEIGRAHV